MGLALHILVASIATVVQCSPPIEMVLALGSGSQNCSRVCRRINLECVLDEVDLRTLSDDFIKEWFSLSGHDPYCNYVETQRSRKDHPHFRASTFVCTGHNSRPSTQYALCDQTSHLIDNYKAYCICDGIRTFAPRDGYMRTKWTKLHEFESLTSGYYTVISTTDELTFLQAQDACWEEIGQLPAIRSKTQNDALQQYALSVLGAGERVWLYGYDSGAYWWDINQHTSNAAYKGPWPYYNWGPGYSSAGTKCTYMSTDDGMWYLTLCSDKMPTICQLNFFAWWPTTWGYFYSEYNTRFGGATLLTANANDLNQCVRLCRENVQCLSADFDIATGDCTMYPRMGSLHKDEMTSSQGTTYVEREIYHKFPDF